MVVMARVVITCIATWAALIALVLSPVVLPERWLYYIYSPASMGLWLLSMLVGPIVACVVGRRWIRTGVWRAGRGAGRA